MKPVIIIAIAFVLLIPVSAFTSDGDLENVDFEILDVSFNSQTPHVLKIKYVITNLENDSLSLRGKDAIDLRVIDYSIHEARVSKTNWIEFFEYVSPAKLEMEYRNSNVTHECKNVDFLIKQGESVTSTICFEVSPAITQYLKPESRKEYHLVLSPKNANYPSYESIRVLIDYAPSQIPDWIKNIASFWCDDKIDDSSFIEVIQYLIENNIIIVSASSGYGSTQEIPSWVKNNACRWSQGLISNGDFASGIEYLVKEGIIRV